jgi:endonuclease YncB( thermonuclease family)
MPRLFVVLWLLVGLLFSSPAAAAVIVGRVVAVADGDTLTISTDTGKAVVRLNGIDAPERGQPHDSEARTALAALAEGRLVTLDTNKRDRYGRLVGRVSIDGTDIGLTMIAEGHAWAFRRYLNELPRADRYAYREAEAQARSASKGLWAQAAPMPPWEWRDNKRAHRPEALPVR